MESKKIKLAEPQSQRLSDVSNLYSPKSRTIRIEKKPTETTAIQTSTNFKITSTNDCYQSFPLLNAFPKEFFEELENGFLAKDITKYSGHKHHDCLSVKSLLSDVYMLSKLSDNALKNQNINSSLFKIISITRALAIKVSSSLTEPNDQLQKRLCKTIKDKVAQDNNNIFQSKPWKNEVFVELRKCLAISSLLVLHCPYIRKFVMDTNYDNCIDYKLNEWFVEHNSCLYLHHKDDRNLLTLLLFILENLPELNLGLTHEALLISITEFIISCFKTLPQCKNILEKILRTLVFAIPPSRVIHRLAELLEFMSIDNTYREILCVDSKEKLSLEFEKGYYGFSKDSCFLQVFAVLLETCISKEYIQQGEYLVLHNLTCSVINFVHNALTNDLKWPYLQIHCMCSSLIMTSVAVLMHYCIEQYKTSFSMLADDQMFCESLSRVLHGGILTMHQLLMRDPAQPNNSIQLSYFGGRFLSVVNFAYDVKERIFKNPSTIEFVDQVLRDLQFYTPLSDDDCKMSDIFEGTYSHKFNITN